MIKTLAMAWATGVVALLTMLYPAFFAGMMSARSGSLAGDMLIVAVFVLLWPALFVATIALWSKTYDRYSKTS